MPFNLDVMFLKRKGEVIKFFLLISILFLVACESEYSPSNFDENTVFESLFLAIQKDAVSPYYLVDETESLWFKENPYNPDDWKDMLEKNPDVSLSIVKSLYKRNKKSQRLDWKPIITTAKLLSGNFLNLNSTNRDELCLVGKDKPHIGVRVNERSYFRPFYSVSRVGFSNDGIFALVKLSYNCAPLSGAGEFFALFRFEDKKWQPVWGKTLWIS